MSTLEFLCSQGSRYDGYLDRAREVADLFKLSSHKWGLIEQAFEGRLERRARDQGARSECSTVALVALMTFVGDEKSYQRLKRAAHNNLTGQDYAEFERQAKALRSYDRVAIRVRVPEGLYDQALHNAADKILRVVEADPPVVETTTGEWAEVESALDRIVEEVELEAGEAPTPNADAEWSRYVAIARSKARVGLVDGSLYYVQSGYRRDGSVYYRGCSFELRDATGRYRTFSDRDLVPVFNKEEVRIMEGENQVAIRINHAVYRLPLVEGMCGKWRFSKDAGPNANLDQGWFVVLRKGQPAPPFDAKVISEDAEHVVWSVGFLGYEPYMKAARGGPAVTPGISITL